MLRTSYEGLDEIEFHPFLFWYLIAYVLLFGFGATDLWFALGSRGVWWWAGVVLAMLLALVLVARYHAQAVIIRGDDLVLRAGMFRARERIFPIWLIDLEIEQGMLGRLFDYGTVRQHNGTDVIAVHTIASVRALRFLIAQRRDLVLRMLAEQRVIMMEPRSGRRTDPSRPHTPPRSIPSRTPR